MNELLVEQGDLLETIDSQDGWELDRRVEIAPGRAALPSGGCQGHDVCRAASGRRVALCKLLLEKPVSAVAR